MYAFYVSTTLESNQGKKFAKEHEGNFDNQMFCVKLHGFHTTSVGARAIVSETLSFTTSTTFDS